MKPLLALAAVTLVIACSVEDPGDYGLDHLTSDLHEVSETPAPRPLLTRDVPAPIVEAEGRTITWNGESISVYEFLDVESAEASESLFELDASMVGGRPLEWKATPHIFRKGRLLVVYDGDDRPTIDSIRRVMGAQFAGGHAPEEEPEEPE